MNQIFSISLSFIFGIIFSVGLSISGMVNPNIVLGFFDIFGKWNPVLLFVMIGALLISTISFHFILKKGMTCTALALNLPKKKKLDLPLVFGAMIFGIGWGLTGICPGPSISNLFLLNGKIFVFVIAMVFGMIIANLKINLPKSIDTLHEK